MGKKSGVNGDNYKPGPGRTPGLKDGHRAVEKAPGCNDTPLPHATDRSVFHPQLGKVKYTHDAMIDEIIANPAVTQKELAAMFGYSQQWVSRVICSDAFLQRLAIRKSEIVSPELIANVEERMRVMEFRAMDIVTAKLDATEDHKLAMQVLNMTTKARAYGARSAPNIGQQNNYVVALPQPVQSADEWAEKYKNGAVIDVEPEKE